MPEGPIPALPLRKRPLAIGALLIAFACVAWVFWKLQLIFLLGFVSVLWATLLSFPIDLLARKMRRGLAVLLVLLAFMGVVVGGVTLAAPAVSDQVGELGQQIPTAMQRLDRWWKRTSRRGPVANLPHADEIAE